jgi:hypothetical protein
VTIAAVTESDFLIILKIEISFEIQKLFLIEYLIPSTVKFNKELQHSEKLKTS